MIKKFNNYEDMCDYFYNMFKDLTDNKLYIPKSFYKKQIKTLIKMYDYNLHIITKDEFPTFFDWVKSLFKKKKKITAGGSSSSNGGNAIKDYATQPDGTKVSDGSAEEEPKTSASTSPLNSPEGLKSSDAGGVVGEQLP